MSQSAQIGAADPLERASTAMRPLRGTLLAHASAEVAWARLLRENLHFLVVVEGGAGRMVGVVTRQSLKPAPCCGRHGSACSVVNHRAADGAYCFAHEGLRGLREAEGALAREYPFPPRRSVPLIVVDRALRPLGFLPPLAAGGDRGRLSAA